MPITRNLQGVGTGAAQSKAIVGVLERNKTATGTTRSDAYLLSEDVTLFTNVASGTGAALRSDSQENDVYTVINYGLNAIKVYPPTGGTVGGGATNAAYSLSAGSFAEFQSIGNNVFIVRLPDSSALISALSSDTGTTLIKGTWFGGVVAYLSALGTSVGASLLGSIATGTGGIARSIQAKLDETKTPADRGAVGDGVANDTTPTQNVVASLDYRLPKATGYSITSLTVSANTMGVADARQAPLNISGTGGVIINGSNIVLKDHRISGPASQQLIYAGASASNVRIDGADLSSDATSSPDGHGVQVNQANCHEWTIAGSRFDVYNFGVLFNTTAGGSKGAVIARNHITTQVGDAIELNTPTTALEDVVVATNVLKVDAGSGTTKGIGIGMAHVNGAAVIGNILPRAWLETFHIEDGCKNITIIGNVSKDCQSDGFRHLNGGPGSNQAQTKSLTAIGNHFEAASIIAGTAGMRVLNDASGTPYSDALIGNVVRNFESGLWLGGEATHFANGNVIDSCTYAMRCESGNVTYTRISGTNHVIGTAATALLYVSSSTGAMVQAGKFVCQNAPTNIILKAAPGTTRPGCSVEGFSWPTSLNNTAGVATYKDLFPAASTNRFKGRIVIESRNHASIADNTWYAADVLWDGTTLTVSGAISESNGALAVAGTPVRVSGGQFQAGFFDAAAITIDIFMNFDGVYLA